MEAHELDRDPFREFDRWWTAALSRANADFPDAAALATAGAGGRPSVRMVLVKAVKSGAFYFYTNYESRKARELHGNPFAALCFYWSENGQGRQIRVEGNSTRATPEESAAYFATRPRGSQLGAWSSPQSQEIPDRAFLFERVRDAEARFPEGKPIPAPPHWGGYRLTADRIEFWLQGKNRLHDRFEYRLEQGGWKIRRLAP